MSVDTDIGEIFRRIAALEANKAGSGLQFDTYPQAGNWLYVETDDLSGSPSGIGIELSDYSSSGIGVGISANSGADLQLRVIGGGDLQLQSAQGLSLSGNDVTIVGTTLLAESGTDLVLTSSAFTGVAVLAAATSTVGRGMYIKLEDDLMTVYTSAGGDPTVTGTPVLRIDNAGGYHIKTGATWVADL